MKYIEIEDTLKDDRPPAERSLEMPRAKRLLYGLLWVIAPPANPDLEPYWDYVKSWWLELGEDGYPCREIGFGVDGEAFVLGPVGNNYGLWTDSSSEFTNSSDPEVQARFAATWDALWPEFAHLAEKAGRDRPSECETSD